MFTCTIRNFHICVDHTPFACMRTSQLCRHISKYPVWSLGKFLLDVEHGIVSDIISLNCHWFNFFYTKLNYIYNIIFLTFIYCIRDAQAEFLLQLNNFSLPPFYIAFSMIYFHQGDSIFLTFINLCLWYISVREILYFSRLSILVCDFRFLWYPYSPQTLSGFATFTCINESLSLRSLISQAVGTHFIWKKAEIVF